MPETVIKNFRFGLDTRRDVLTSQLGTLATLENAHVNNGAEIEQRKAFVPYTVLPSFTFGCQETSTGLVTFGSIANPTYSTTFRFRSTNFALLTIGAHVIQVGDYVTVSGVGGTGYNGTALLVVAISATQITYACVGANEGSTADVGGTVVFYFPTGVTYQRLQHPWESLLGGSAVVMSGITHSSCFNGNTFVIAAFSAYVDGSGNYFNLPATTICFYNGIAIIQHYIGKVLGTSSLSVADQLAKLSAKLTSVIDDYLADLLFTGEDVSPSYTKITGPAGKVFTLTAEYSTSSTLAKLQIIDTYAQAAASAVLAVAATTSFYIVKGNSGSVDTINDASSGVQLITSPVNFNTSLLQTALDVATAINARTGTSGYSAQATLANGSSLVARILISASTTTGAAANGVILNIGSTTLKVDSQPTGAGSVSVNLIAISIQLQGGITSVPAISQVGWALFNGSATQFAYGDTWTLTVTYNSIDYTIGAGNICGITPTFALPVGSKMYMCAGQTFYFSSIANATLWENQNTGAGTVDVKDQSFSPSSVAAFAPFQGKLAVFCRWNTQIWVIDSDPANYAQSQNLEGVGTFAPLSVRAKGELDVYFLSDTGVRALRPIVSTLNAELTDVGSQIDVTIQAALATAGTNTTACAVIDPATHNYWLHLKGTIYVLADHRTSEISAWSTYLPTYRASVALTVAGSSGQVTTLYGKDSLGADVELLGGAVVWTTSNNATAALIVTAINARTVTTGYAASSAGAVVTITPPLNAVPFMTSTVTGTMTLTAVYTDTSFTPVKFLTYQGQVYCLDSGRRLYRYGGGTNTMYDGCQVTAELPWLDGGDPLQKKTMRSIGVVKSGKWTISGGTDPISGTLETITDFGTATGATTSDSSTTLDGMIPWKTNGVNFKLKAVSSKTNTAKVLLGALAISFDKAEKR